MSDLAPGALFRQTDWRPFGPRSQPEVPHRRSSSHSQAETEVYDYLVLTAAITRPDLHAQVFPGYLRLIGSARVKWLVNVDDVGTGHTLDETIDHLTRLLAVPNVDVEFLRPAGPGCFFQAARRLALRAGELLAQCRAGVVWLEDDWQLATLGRAGDALTGLRVGLAGLRDGHRLRRCPGDLETKRTTLQRETERRNPLWFVSLVPRYRVSFNPGIWSKDLFLRAMLEPLSRQPADRVDDPETLCADPWNQADARRRFTLFMSPAFQDAGRRWSAERGLSKWEKAPVALASRGAVTYACNAPTDEMARESHDDLVGWVRIRRAFGTRLPVLGRITVRDGRLTGRILAFPYVAFDVRPTGERTAELYLHRLHRWSRTYPYKKIDAKVVWESDGGELQVRTRRGPLVGSLGSTRPASMLWIVPLQASLGFVFFTMSFVARLIHFDAGAKSL